MGSYSVPESERDEWPDWPACERHSSGWLLWLGLILVALLTICWWRRRGRGNLKNDVPDFASPPKERQEKLSDTIFNNAEPTRSSSGSFEIDQKIPLDDGLLTSTPGVIMEEPIVVTNGMDNKHRRTRKTTFTNAEPSSASSTEIVEKTPLDDNLPPASEIVETPIVAVNVMTKHSRKTTFSNAGPSSDSQPKIVKKIPLADDLPPPSEIVEAPIVVVPVTSVMTNKPNPKTTFPNAEPSSASSTEIVEKIPLDNRPSSTITLNNAEPTRSSSDSLEIVQCASACVL